MTKDELFRRGVVVDEQDLHWLDEYGWWLNTPSRHVRAHVRGGRGTVYLHRLIMDAPDGYEVDHIDGNPLNNRRSNLRVCSHKENLRNRRGAARNNTTSGVRGVTKHGPSWGVQVNADGKYYWLGRFKTIEEASAAAVELRKKVHG